MKFPKPKTITGWLVMGGLAIYVVWELIVVYLGDRKALISPFIKQAWNHPMLMVVFGALIGHFVIPASTWSHWAFGQGIRWPLVPFLVGAAITGSWWAMKR